MTALASAAVFAGEPVAGGICFTAAVNVDGTDYPANTTIYAESYPTQFVVTPAADTYPLFAKSDSTHGSTPIFAGLDGKFTVMPPPTPGDVVTYTFTTGNPLWVDASYEGGDGDGTERKPYKQLSDVYVQGKSYYIVYVKAGTYNTVGTPASDSDIASVFSFDGLKNISKPGLIRAVDGPEVTFIEGAPDADSTATGAYEGMGPNALRGVKFGNATQAIQGFTIRNCYTSDKTDTVVLRKAGAAIKGNSKNSSFVLDCVIEDNRGAASIADSATAIRCKFADNVSLGGVMSDVRGVFSTILAADSTEPSDDRSIIGAGPFYNCTFGGTDRNTPIYPNDTVAYNSIFIHGGKSRTATGSGNWVEDMLHYLNVGEGFTHEDPKLTDAVNGDFRLTDISPCIDSVDLPAAASDYWKWATTDVNGNRLRITPDGKLTAGAVQTDFVEVFKGKLYVDPVNGKDTNDGLHRESALKTIAAAMAHPDLASGTTIYVEPGRYDASNTPAVDSGDKKGLSRVSIPAGVTLASLGTAADTFLVGAESETVGETTGAVRCAILHADSKICGFTLTGGYTDANVNGAGVLSAATPSFACDCVISNNVSRNRGGGANAMTCIRCRFADNSAGANIGAAANAGMLVGCVVDSQRGTCSRTYTATIRNCTFLPTKNAADQQEAINYGSTESISVENCKNSVILCLTRHEANYTRCIIATNAVDAISKGRTYDPAVLGDTVTLLKTSEAQVKADGTLRRNSPAIDAGDNALYDLSWGDVDIKGSPRIINDTIDLGACEFDPSLQKGLLMLVR